VRCPVYTVRVAAPDKARGVDVAVDQGAWRPCRRSVGYWWYDWSGYTSGEHEMIARVRMRDGEVVTSEPHEFFIDLGPHDREANA
jgi:hypothetical protein